MQRPVRDNIKATAGPERDGRFKATADEKGNVWMRAARRGRREYETWTQTSQSRGVARGSGLSLCARLAVSKRQKGRS
jgi:hypothetical protein